ncbi:uncharacterized protein LOC120431258 [Culex pipiens pallens]|uniref:uncharacterized protein LOC120431258 n=1 Tax=Culex pipiens pallens TaxID=42434 RepID=UPI0022AB4988|nr:uncharacterized protein LOC120431258 [Culex pipiens pallens]XP_052567345.1 uncharacterized protein LOC120431258 [Culex pipiens pallens]XP_052567346.1 uncharacterized protein LOC120431258 [Culex pipiens pallens]XP_052567347.1 uncharacterized protein LOC120431258 [Culex pipiens pallens]XP_052567348.1 uncharacterized protein LOC120431258 [Culex pipiens pallens]XP_052567349.1 uncharacterized protein LOC120431258 [Culex pipiens pallens]
MKMKAFVNGRSIECTVKNVLFTPHLRHNLLSVVRIEQAGMRVVFENGKAQIYRGNELIVCGARRNSLYEMDFRTVDREKMLLCDRAQTEHNLIALAECYMVSTSKQIVGRKCKKTIICDTCGAGKQTPCGTWVEPSREDVGYEAGERVEVGLERKQQNLVRPIAADADEPGGDPAEEEFGRWDEEPETEPNDREEEESGTAGADAEPGRGRGFALFATSYIDNITQTIAERTKPDEVIDSLGCNKKCSLTMLPIARTPVTCKWSRWKRGDGVVADKYETNRNVPAGVFVGSSKRRRTRSQMDFSRGTPRGVGCVDCCVEV